MFTVDQNASQNAIDLEITHVDNENYSLGSSLDSNNVSAIDDNNDIKKMALEKLLAGNIFGKYFFNLVNKITESKISQRKWIVLHLQLLHGLNEIISSVYCTLLTFAYVCLRCCFIKNDLRAFKPCLY